MKILLVNEPSRLYVKCEQCKKMIGEHAPAVESSYGFVAEDGFYVEESIVMHAECVEANTLGKLLEKVSHN